MAEGIDLIVKHDTELCADESGCGRDSWQHGLCKRHHQTAWSKGELPPQFKICRSGHALGERNAAGLRWCAACRPCNTALGMLGDNPKLMRRAASYVEERHD